MGQNAAISDDWLTDWLNLINRPCWWIAKCCSAFGPIYSYQVVETHWLQLGSDGIINNTVDGNYVAKSLTY